MVLPSPVAWNSELLTSPLSPGNIVTIALNLYLSHFRDYLKISFHGVLWVLLPGLLTVSLFTMLSTAPGGLLFLVGLSGFVAIIYGVMKFLTHSALISRLAFNHLIQNPETSEEAKRQIKKKQWSFFWLALIVLVFFVIAYIVFSVVFFALAGFFTFFLAGFGMNADQNTMIATGLLVALVGLLLFLLFIIAIITLYARLSLLELPIATDITVTLGQAVNNNFKITKKSAYRIMRILSIAFLVNSPLYLVFQASSLIVQGIFAAVLVRTSPVMVIFSYVLGYAISGGGWILLTPFWQSLKSVLYYDLKNQKEGFDLQLEPIKDTVK